MARFARIAFITALTIAVALLTSLPVASADDFELKKGEHVVYIGNTMADRMQHHGWLETYIHALHPDFGLTFRNLGFSGDEVKNRPRSANFGDANQWLTKTKADVVFCFFGYNEALRGEAALEGFKKDLAGMIDDMRSRKYNGRSAPRLVVFSPIAHENLRSRHLPDGTANNEKLNVYTKAMRDVCQAKNVTFVDLFSPTQRLYANADKPLTMNGIHLLDHGNKAVAETIIRELFPNASLSRIAEVEDLREAVLEKNYHWFSRYRVVDGYNVYGGRSRLAWHGQSNADVMRREMEIFDVMTANRDKIVWAAAQGRKLTAKDDNIPKQLTVKTNKVGPLEGGKWPYLDGVGAIDKMRVANGMEINLFASEKEFPRLINPVQMAVDTDSRLWASVWPSYPHWNPTEPREDALLILPDDDHDGKADRCIVFADELNSVTAFEFWGGGVLVAAPPEIWFLKDTDGDDKADVKIRMLQGVSSADTHHSANAMVVGPDGWLYWSRGIFNIANFETPTKTFRSGASGVHRFNPRTFEFEFHFPIGPNPHGDVIDQWGYQFASDGTTGTGSYVNIGKGIGNKQWFRKRVRPVPATGILDSSHFPEANKGNFLICNAIGVLGVLQHEVKYDGADISATEIEPIVLSSDPNFRPSDVEIGGDGALYIADWHNTLIGHMQHNMRDPNRDHDHGRIYRVTAKGRPLLKPAKMKGASIESVCENFFARENSTRYRARLELSGREEAEVVAKVGAFAARLNPANDPRERDEAQALLECLWVFEEQRLPNLALLNKVFQANEPRVRAAAIRTLGHWAGRINGWEPILVAAARDDSALVRAEAVKAAVEFPGLTAAEAIFEAATRPLDPEMETVLKYAKSKIKVDALVRDAVNSGRKLSSAAQAYMLQNASAADLLKLDRSDAVYAAILRRGGIPSRYRWDAISALAKKNGRTESQELVDRIQQAERNGHNSVPELAQMLAGSDEEQLDGLQPVLAKLATATQSSPVRTAAYAAWIRLGGAKDAWDHAAQKSQTLSDLLNSLASVESVEARAELFERIRPLMFELPDHLGKAQGGSFDGPPVAFEYFEPNPSNVQVETLKRLKPKFKGRLKNFETFVPKGRRDAFATKQSTFFFAPSSGKYTFFTASDDGSRLYVNGKQVVNNDGNHGMQERSGQVQLESGLHELVVTYYDNGGGDGLRVSWQGPGIAKQKMPASVLRAGGGDLRTSAINVVARWPGHFNAKVSDFARLIKQTKDQGPAALQALSTLPPQRVTNRLQANDASAILDKLIAQAEKATPVKRQSNGYARLLGLGDRLVTKIDADRASTKAKLAELRASIPERANPAVMALGKEAYSRESHCATCHQPHGQGLPNLYPPLDGSLWATGSEDRLIRVALDGMHGTIEVKGKTYSSPPLPPMTAFRQLLNDEEMAAVLTFVRNSWSNRAKPISPQKVASVRAATKDNATFWYAADLMTKFPLEDGRLPITTARADGWVPKFVKAWKYDEIPLEKMAEGRTFATGEAFFNRLGCAQCHKLGEKGGLFGPDLSKLDKKKQDPAYLLRSILEPSKDIDKQYSVSTFFLDSGRVVTGLIVDEKPDAYHVVTDPLKQKKPTIVKKDEIDEQTKSASSIMPQGMLNWLTEEEILDLLAYVYSKGKKNHEFFQK